MVGLCGIQLTAKTSQLVKQIVPLAALTFVSALQLSQQTMPAGWSMTAPTFNFVSSHQLYPEPWLLRGGRGGSKLSQEKIKIK